MLNLSSRSCSKNERTADNPISSLQYFLLPIIFVGAILRLWNLGTWSLWIDEVLTVVDAQEFSLDTFRINPVPYLVVKLALAMGATDEWGARLIPCLVGIASIPLIFLMGRSLFNSRVGLLAAAFVAFSNWHLFWSQNARSYIFTFLFGALTVWSFFVACERDRPIVMIGALTSAICLILSHTLSVILLPALGGYVISFCWRGAFRQSQNASYLTDEASTDRPAGLRLRNLAIFFLPFIMPLFLLNLPEFRSYLFSGWGLNEWQRSPIYIILTLVYGLSIPIAVTAFFALFVNPLDRSIRFLICYAGIPLALFLIASRILNVAGYYLFFSTPAYFLLAAVCCERIWQTKLVPLPIRAILPCLIIVTMLSQNYLYFCKENGGRPKWREAFSTVRSGMDDDDLVVASVPRMSQYYLPELEPTAVKMVLENTTEFEKEWKAERVRVWFVIDAASFNIFDSGREFRRWVRQRARLIRTFPVFARTMDRTISVYLWEVTK